MTESHFIKLEVSDSMFIAPSTVMLNDDNDVIVLKSKKMFEVCKVLDLTSPLNSVPLMDKASMLLIFIMELLLPSTTTL